MNLRMPKGVFAAALTPLRADGSLDLDGLLPYLDFLARRGCHGVLLFGTTGEGPSFALRQRMALGQVARAIKQDHPDFVLMMGTGTPSLDETIAMTRGAFEVGMDGVVVLPPYFVRKASDDGLYAWFCQVLANVPEGGFCLGYNIPQMTGMHLSLDLLARLKESYPQTFLGIKNSWLEEEYARSLGTRFGSDLLVLTGFDNFFQMSLGIHAVGCITASASLISPLLRRVWDLTMTGQDAAAAEAQAEVIRIRAILDSRPPTPALLKALLARWHGFPLWNVCPPLMQVSAQDVDAVAEAVGGPL